MTTEAHTLSSTSPLDHLRAGHSVVAFWKEDTAGYLSLDSSEIDHTDYIDVYDTESLESGPTEQIECRDCGLPLDTEREDGTDWLS